MTTSRTESPHPCRTARGTSSCRGRPAARGGLLHDDGHVLEQENNHVQLAYLSAHNRHLYKLEGNILSLHKSGTNHFTKPTGSPQYISLSVQVNQRHFTNLLVLTFPKFKYKSFKGFVCYVDPFGMIKKVSLNLSFTN